MATAFICHSLSLLCQTWVMRKSYNEQESRDAVLFDPNEQELKFDFRILTSRKLSLYFPNRLNEARFDME